MSDHATPPHADGPAIDHAAARAAMVRTQFDADIVDERVKAAMRTVPRHRFVPAELSPCAYDDSPLPIGRDQTISQPFIVAAMTELAAITPGARVLEIGTGSGYEVAVLAELGAEVWSIEIDPVLAERAAHTLRALGLGPDRVHLRTGDGWTGWPDAAPFDAIIVSAAPPTVPPALLAQLGIGARLVIPVGVAQQELRVIARQGAERFVERTVFPVRFVPMTGAAQG